MTIEEIRKSLPSEALMNVEGLPFKKIASGKVREIFDLGDKLLIVATDRISAFDSIMPNGVPGKGILLTQISLWWFAQAAKIMPTHLVPDHDAAVAELLKDFPQLVARSMIVRKLKPLPIEAVVRGYLAGSGWKEYRKTQAILDHALPAGMLESQRLPEAIFTPSTKAAEGHDEPITEARCAEILGAPVFEKVKAATLALFALGSKVADHAGLILADTKFEFGLDDAGNLFLIDEVLTPDSSRYWPQEGYAPGRSQPSFDKQFVRDYLEDIGWNKLPPAPALPADVVAKSRDLYFGALEKLMSL
ncbi:phosphoribosylaminoimidazolesuccinocarboxamide synthase [Candidatus Spyradosoma sp. SGI.093]|uniref:phosphoribosylaminoimidazolesuccinocarboxamide synthase n=1 Tax=Candidatus Spyradosoma sp. SGI.093 TaxID=3420583 RepID=UPI003D08ECDB